MKPNEEVYFFSSILLALWSGNYPTCAGQLSYKITWHKRIVSFRLMCSYAREFIKPDFHSHFSLVANEILRIENAQSGETNRIGRKNIFRSVGI